MYISSSIVSDTHDMFALYLFSIESMHKFATIICMITCMHMYKWKGRNGFDFHSEEHVTVDMCICIYINMHIDTGMDTI